MEIYNLYLSISIFFSDIIYGEGGRNLAIIKNADGLIRGFLVAFAVWSVFFIFQAIGLYEMGKRRGMKHKWMAFVPFINLLFMGKLAGTCEFFGHRMRGAGVYAMIAQIVTTLFCAFAVFAEIYLYSTYGTPNYATPDSALGLPVWTNLSGAGVHIFNFYNISDYILSILELVYQILMFILVMGLYRKYSPKNYVMFSFLELFVPLSRYFVIFALRKRAPIDFDAYMRAKREAFMRQQQRYNPYHNPYGQPYNNPYGNPYGQPYHNPYGQPQGQDTAGGGQPEDPFAEFSQEGDAKKGENTDGKDPLDPFF